MKHLVLDAERRVHVVPWLSGYALPTGGGEWLLYAGTDETITVRGSVEDLDRVVAAIEARGVPPHSTISRTGDGYTYEPWDMRISVYETSSGAGNSFISEIDGVTVILYRLRNLRRLISRVTEAT